MTDKIVLKRLTRSDLTFFKTQHAKQMAGHQKAINLNANVFVQQLYPSLPTIAEERDNEMPVVIGIFGPGIAPEHRLTRKIIKGDAYKNWRLNGEFVADPDDQPKRYDSLAEGDYAIMLFHGDTHPTSLDMVLICASKDIALHTGLSALAGTTGMLRVDKGKLIGAVETSKVTEEHPIRDLLFLDEALEDAALGGAEGAKSLLSRPSGTKLTPWQLAKARQRAEEIGRVGEAFVNAWLGQRETAGQIAGPEWVAKENAVQPYDFHYDLPSGGRVEVDVKATRHGFETVLHISLNELRQMAHTNNRYDICRVYEVRDNEAEMRICEGMKDFASDLLGRISLPSGIAPDGFSIKPSVLKFGSPITIRLPSE